MNKTIACATDNHDTCLGFTQRDTRAAHLQLIAACECQHHARNEAKLRHPAAGTLHLRVAAFARRRSRGFVDANRYEMLIIQYLRGLISNNEFDAAVGEAGHALAIGKEFRHEAT